MPLYLMATYSHTAPLPFRSCKLQAPLPPYSTETATEAQHCRVSVVFYMTHQLFSPTPSSAATVALHASVCSTSATMRLQHASPPRSLFSRPRFPTRAAPSCLLAL